MFEWFWGDKPNMYVIKTDMFYPEETRGLKFIGAKPSRILREVSGFLKNVFRVHGSDTYEDRLKWDIAADPIKFFGKWRVRKKLDDRSTFWAAIKVTGEQDHKTGEGWVTISVKAQINAEIPYHSTFDKFLKHLYFQKFYMKQQRSNMRRVMKNLNDFDAALRELYGMHPKVHVEEAR